MRPLTGVSTTAWNGKGPEDFERWAVQVKDLGFTIVEFVSEYPHPLTQSTWRGYYEILESLGLELTIHAPFSDINIASFNNKIREVSLYILRETLEVASEMGARVVTIHPGHCSPLSRKYQEEYLRIHRRSLAEVERMANEFGVTVGVENMPRFPILDAQTPERLEELLKGVDLGVTFDVGHLNTTGANFEEFLQKFKDRIVHLHIHDNNGKSDEHLPPGSGTVPWELISQELPPTTWILEVGSLSEAAMGRDFLLRFLKRSKPRKV